MFVMQTSPIDNKVSTLLQSPCGDNCVDVFVLDDGTFGFEEYRRDPAEDESGANPPCPCDGSRPRRSAAVARFASILVLPLLFLSLEASAVAEASTEPTLAPTSADSPTPVAEDPSGESAASARVAAHRAGMQLIGFLLGEWKGSMRYFVDGAWTEPAPFGGRFDATMKDKYVEGEVVGAGYRWVVSYDQVQNVYRMSSRDEVS